jgi:hypothetical protein
MSLLSEELQAPTAAHTITIAAPVARDLLSMVVLQRSRAAR